MAKILLVEDDPCVQEVLSRRLKATNNEVTIAPDGKSALEALAKSDFNIILCDHDMPVMNGYEFTRRLKTDPAYSSYSHIPVIGIGDFPKDKKEFLAETRTKPIDFKDLDECIEKYCK
jgi:CheY-like chemotaxis protein